MNKLTPIFVILIVIAMLFSTVDQALADTTVVITPSSMGDWSFHQFAPSGSGAITDGPDTPPLGFGSARLTTNNNGGYSLETTGFPSTRLDSLTRLEYSSYRSTSDPSNNRTVTLRLEMDYNIVDPDRSNQGWLVYEPFMTAGTGTVSEDTWYTWNALTGKWYATNDLGSNRCTQSNPCTITQLLSWFPHAGVRHNGSVQLAAGDHWNLAFTGYTDALTLGVNGVNTTYDFELNDPPTVSAGGPYTGIEGSDVNLDGTSSDPDGDLLTYAWSYTSGPDFDPGATCTFTDTAALDATISCTDAGEFSLTLSVDDGVNPPVASSATLTLSETNPSVNITAPSDGASFREGDQVDVSAEVSDAANDSLTCTVDWGDGTTSAGAIVDGVCTAAHVYNTPGDYTITVTVTDDDGGSASQTVGITVFNDPPTAEAGGPYTGDEGFPVSLDGTASDLEGDSLTITWSFAPGPGVDSGATCTFADAAALDTTFSCTDDGLFTLALTVDDGTNPPDSDNTTIFLGNLEPTLNISAPSDGASFDQGQQVDLSARFEEAGDNDTLTCQIDWGDGTVLPGNVAGDDCTAGHAYTAPGEYSLTVTVTDDDGGSNSATIVITILNNAPTVEPGGPYTGDEGSDVSVSGSASDPEADPLTYAWSYTPGLDVDSGATCTFADASATATSISCTDDGSYTLNLTVNDGMNSPVTASAMLTISNRAPIATLTAPADGSAFTEDGIVNLAATFTDDGSNDTHTCEITWGDGSTSDGVVADETCTASHAYSAPGDISLTVIVLDDDGLSGSDSASITINPIPNNPPASDAGGPYAGAEGQAINLTGSASDPDGDPLTVAWAYTPGAGVKPGTTCTFGNPAAPATSFFCTDNGEFSLTLTLDDGHNPPVSDTASITINNRPPVVTLDGLVGNPIFQIGDDVELSAAISDPGINDTQLCDVNWGDGTISDGVISNSACIASYTYSVQGEYLITVTVTDDDGGSGFDSASVSISDELPPPVAPVYLPLMNKIWNSSR